MKAYAAGKNGISSCLPTIFPEATNFPVQGSMSDSPCWQHLRTTWADCFRQDDLLEPFLAIRLTIKFIEHVPPGARRRGRDLAVREVGYTYTS